MKRALLCFLLLGCTKTKTTATGPLGDVDFTDKLPAGIKAPVESRQNSYERTTTTCRDPQQKSIDVKVKWWVFENGPDAYITKAHFELTRVDDGMEVTMGKSKEIGGMSLTAGAPYRQIASVSVTCNREVFRSGYQGGGTVSFDVDGKIHE